jgi:putative transposase
VFDKQVDEVLREICLEIEKRYENEFVEIVVGKAHVHFLGQSVPMYSVMKLVKMIKSLTAKEVLRCCPSIKQKLWGGEFWSDGYCASTVGKDRDEGMIAEYVKNQGNEYLQF